MEVLYLSKDVQCLGVDTAVLEVHLRCINRLLHHSGVNISLDPVNAHVQGRPASHPRRNIQQMMHST